MRVLNLQTKFRLVFNIILITDSTILTLIYKISQDLVRFACAHAPQKTEYIKLHEAPHHKF